METITITEEEIKASAHYSESMEATILIMMNDHNISRRVAQSYLGDAENVLDYRGSNTETLALAETIYKGGQGETVATMVEDIEMKSSRLETETMPTERKELCDALYVLTLARMKFNHSKAKPRHEVIRELIDEGVSKDGFYPIRITGYIDTVIKKAYVDADEIKKTCETLNTTLNSIPEHLEEHLVDVKKVISDGKKFYEEVMGESFYLSSRPNTGEVPF